MEQCFDETAFLNKQVLCEYVALHDAPQVENGVSLLEVQII